MKEFLASDMIPIPEKYIQEKKESEEDLQKIFNHEWRDDLSKC